VTEQVTLWELIAYVDGHNRANGADDKVEAPSDDQFADMLARHNISNTVN
jgi:hypothetical protein